MDTFLRWSHKHDAVSTNTPIHSQQKEIGTAKNFGIFSFDITKVVSTYFVRRQSHCDPVLFELRRTFEILPMLVQHSFPYVRRR